MGAQGVAEFQKFVESGGLLVTLGASSAFPADFGILPRVDTSNPTPKFYAPGPIVEAEITQPANPIFYGYSTATVARALRQRPALPPGPGAGQIRRAHALSRRRQERAQRALQRRGRDQEPRRDRRGRASDKGEIVMFATNPVWRWQNVGEFRMMFNTLLNYKRLEK